MLRTNTCQLIQFMSYLDTVPLLSMTDILWYLEKHAAVGESVLESVL